MNLFDLYARITLDADGYNRGIAEAENRASKFGQSLKVIAGAGVAAVGTAVAGLVKLGKASVSAYGDYEQLHGGIETMFADLGPFVEENAGKAFETAGLSMNEYMETAMGFSAALTSSLRKTDGDISRSAELTDMAIRDMSDNANKMGSDMGAIQTAYQGFAKQNYTMLDNLKLGYGFVILP